MDLPSRVSVIVLTAMAQLHEYAFVEVSKMCEMKVWDEVWDEKLKHKMWTKWGEHEYKCSIKLKRSTREIWKNSNN